MEIHLRQAILADRPVLFSWRNEPWIIQHGSRQTAVTWEEHTEWFGKVLAGDNHLLFIIETAASEGIGCLRFERRHDDSAEIHIYLLQTHTGRGIGPRAIAMGCTAAFEHWPALERIRASVRNENLISCRAFARAGFTTAPGTSGDHIMLELLRARQLAVPSEGWRLCG